MTDLNENLSTEINVQCSYVITRNFLIFKRYIQHLVNPITSNIITDIGAILQNKHVNMSNNNITRSYLGWGYLFPVYELQIIPKYSLRPTSNQEIRSANDMRIWKYTGSILV